MAKWDWYNGNQYMGTSDSNIIPPGPYNFHSHAEWQSHTVALEHAEKQEKTLATQAETDGYTVGHAFGVLFNKQLDMSEYEELRSLAENFARLAGYNDMRLGGTYIKAFGNGYIDATKGQNKSSAALLASPIEDEDD